MVLVPKLFAPRFGGGERDGRRSDNTRRRRPRSPCRRLAALLLTPQPARGEGAEEGSTEEEAPGSEEKVEGAGELASRRRCGEGGRRRKQRGGMEEVGEDRQGVGGELLKS
jgi:hypothetical protein